MKEQAKGNVRWRLTRAAHAAHSERAQRARLVRGPGWTREFSLGGLLVAPAPRVVASRNFSTGSGQPHREAGGVPVVFRGWSASGGGWALRRSKRARGL